MAGQKAKEVITRYNSLIWLCVAIFTLVGLVIKPMVWPDRIEGKVEQLQAEDIRIKEAIRGKADKAIVEKDQELIKQDLGHVKDKVDRLEKMVEYLYFRSGGKPLKGGD